MVQVREHLPNMGHIYLDSCSKTTKLTFSATFYLVEDDDEIMGDDGLLGGTTSVDDLKITGNISSASSNTSIIGGKYI